MSANAEKKSPQPRKASTYIAMGVLGAGVAGVVATLFLSKPSAQPQSPQAPVPFAANAPKVGQPAPDFDLPRADGSGDVRLSALRGKQVLLVFYRTHT